MSARQRDAQASFRIRGPSFSPNGGIVRLLAMLAGSLTQRRTGVNGDPGRATMLIRRQSRVQSSMNLGNTWEEWCDSMKRGKAMRRKTTQPRRGGASGILPRGTATRTGPGGIQGVRVPLRLEHPRCCTCGKPLLRVPASVAVMAGRGGGYQCGECFYPGVVQPAKRGGIVSADKTRWWANLLEAERGGSD